MKGFLTYAYIKKWFEDHISEFTEEEFIEMWYCVVKRRFENYISEIVDEKLLKPECNSERRKNYEQ